MPADKETILETISRARSGNQFAYSQLLDAYWSEVFHFLLSRTQNENDAEDITIQTFARAFDKIDSYDSQFAFNTWLITIAKNLHTDLLRKRKREIAEGTAAQQNEAVRRVLDDAPSAEDRLIIEQDLKSLLQHIKQLKPGYREVIDLRYFREMSYAQIAEELSEPIGNVKVKLLRAKKLLAALISGQSKGK